MSRPTPPTYKTKIWLVYIEALECCGSLTVWGLKTSGPQASMAVPNDAFGAKSISGPTSAHWRFGPLRSGGDHTGDAPVLADLPRQTPAGKEIAPSPLTVPVTHASATMQLPTGVRMPLSRPQNANPFKAITAGEMARNEALRSTKCLGRAHWRNWSGYHRQSRVETKMRCMKLLGQRLMAGASNARFSRSRSVSPLRTAAPHPEYPSQTVVGQVRQGKGQLGV